jgi:hypothetical protein
MTRPLTLLVATVALLTALVAGGAFGRMGHQCTGQPCTGNRHANILYEHYGNGVADTIYGRGGATSFTPSLPPATGTASTATKARTG